MVVSEKKIHKKLKILLSPSSVQIRQGITFILSFLPLIYSGAGMTREQESKRARIEIICRGDPVWSPENYNCKWQSTIRISSTQRGEDKGEGEINTLPIADCRLSVEKKQKLDSCWNLPLIYSCPLPINIKKQVYR
jgi:hypothetical protein